jgi:hypothetical protein
VVYILLGTHAWTMCTDHVCPYLSMNKIREQRGMTKACEKEDREQREMRKGWENEQRETQGQWEKGSHEVVSG